MAADFFEEAMKKASSRELSVVDLIGSVEKVAINGGYDAVVLLYRTWIDNNSENPLAYAVGFNYGVVLTDNGDLEGAKKAFLEAIRLNATFWPAYINLGSVYERMGALPDAINQWMHVANALPSINRDAITHKLTALKQLGRVLEGAQIEPNAEETLRMSLEIDPRQRDVMQHWIAVRQTQCKWPLFPHGDIIGRKRLVQGLSPLSMGAYTDDPMFQLANAERYFMSDVATVDGVFAAGDWPVPEKDRVRRLRIGYVSSDLREHAVGFLTADMFGLHDRQKFEIFAYYCGIRTTDSTQDRIKRGVDHWVDISGMKDAEAARQIIGDEIDILVDLNGYTRDARTKVFAMRPAPVIVNWLGYPGSMGSPVHHYIVADETTIPPGSEKYYSEKVLRLPCYQPNDRNRTVSPRTPTRAEAGLPENAVIYCSFNGLQKLTPFTFGRWMRILRNVPNSILWTLGGTAGANERLLGMAEAQGVTRDRIVFAAKLPNPAHLARYPLADLFLDTTPYGAHTTASDALWMGVPVLTLPGRSFPSRVCASLLKSAGLEEMICQTTEEYVERAIAYGKNPEQLRKHRSQLISCRESCILFDTQRSVTSIERLYEQMWQEYCQGALPKPDLRNLGVYYQIGCDIDHDATEIQTVPDYEEMYRRKLAQIDAFSPLVSDCRLWTANSGSVLGDVAAVSVRLPSEGPRAEALPYGASAAPAPVRAGHETPSTGEGGGWLTAIPAKGIGELHQ